MAQEMGESREAWGADVWKMAEGFANNLSKEEKPFYIVYACKPDKIKKGVFRQTMKAYYNRPQPILGILVWYVNHPTGEFRLVPELSSPPDIPLDQSLLSTDSQDSFADISARGKNLNVLLS